MPQNFIAMVALPGNAPPQPKAVVRAVESMLGPDDPRPSLVDQNMSETNSFVISIGPFAVAVIKFPFAVPTGTVEDALANELHWKDARTAFARAKAHAVVAVISPSGDSLELVKQARLLTVVTSAVTTAWRGTGIFWPSASAVIEPARFTSDAAAMVASPYACPLWFSFRFYPGPDHDQDSRIVCQSTGLEIFLGREIECGPYDMNPGLLAERVMSIARFMASSGPVFADGHSFSFGRPEDVDAILEYRFSPLGGVHRPVFGLRLIAQERKAA